MPDSMSAPEIVALRQTTAEHSTAEKDMEIIRTEGALATSFKLAAAAAASGGAVGAVKNTYRKRSVSCFLVFPWIRGHRSWMCNASARHSLENVICVILERRLSGAEVQMVPGRCVTPVAFVRIACHVTTCTQLGSLL